jgi:hypothetical protein
MSDRTSRSGRQWPVHGTPQRPSIRFPRMGSSVPTIRFRVVFGKRLRHPRSAAVKRRSIGGVDYGGNNPECGRSHLVMSTAVNDTGSTAPEQMFSQGRNWANG